MGGGGGWDEWFEEEVFFCSAHDIHVHAAVFGAPPTEEEVLFGEVFEDGVGHAADGEGAVGPGVGAGWIDGQRPQARDYRAVLFELEAIGDALDGVEPFGVAGDLGEAREFEG